jgi:hypothetical protein
LGKTVADFDLDNEIQGLLNTRGESALTFGWLMPSGGCDDFVVQTRIG